MTPDQFAADPYGGQPDHPSLSELQAAQIPRAKWTDILAPKEGAEPPSAEDQAKLDKYFAAFVSPKDRKACVCCGRKFRGGIEGFLLGGAPDSTTFEWGIVHGEGFCRVCRWPMRAYHFDIGGKDDPIIKRMEVVLQYHPDELHAREPKAATC